MGWYAAEIINAFPGIEGSRYLEIGVHECRTFAEVRACYRVGVDPDPKKIESRSILCVTRSDVFFEVVGRKLGPFDVVYIDGDHTFEQVLRDWNNAVAVLSLGGIIVVDDLLPEREEDLRPLNSGTGYRLLAAMLARGDEVWMQERDPRLKDYGVCVFPAPKRWVGEVVERSLEEFLKLMERRPRDPLSELKRFVSLLPR
ncbi:MAG: class I SAM-dependent methyltransferase [Nitrospiria bacterium]